VARPLSFFFSIFRACFPSRAPPHPHQPLNKSLFQFALLKIPSAFSKARPPFTPLSFFLLRSAPCLPRRRHIGSFSDRFDSWSPWSFFFWSPHHGGLSFVPQCFELRLSTKYSGCFSTFSSIRHRVFILLRVFSLFSAF